MSDKDELTNKLNNINVDNIKDIQIRKIGLLDVFGKLVIDVSYLDDSKQRIEVLSPVPVDVITKWLDVNNLLDITTLYEF